MISLVAFVSFCFIITASFDFFLISDDYFGLEDSELSSFESLFSLPEDEEPDELDDS